MKYHLIHLAAHRFLMPFLQFLSLLSQEFRVGTPSILSQLVVTGGLHQIWQVRGIYTRKYYKVMPWYITISLEVSALASASPRRHSIWNLGNLMADLSISILYLELVTKALME